MVVAADASYPYDSQSAAEVQWDEMFAARGAGVIAGAGLELVPSAGSGRQVLVDNGRAWVGMFGKFTSQKALAVTANASGNPRIDRLVLRNNLPANQVELDVIVGTPAASPTAPALTNNSTIKEFSLARIGPLPNGYANTTGLVVDERLFISPLGAAAADATARDLWIPTPGAGMTVLTRDTNGLFVFNGSSWVQLRRSTIPVAYTPGGNEDTGSPGTWPTGLSVNVTVPAWATRARMFAKIGQVRALTGVCNIALDVRLGALIADQDRIRWDNTLTPAGAEKDITLAGDIDCSSIAGTTVAFRTFANTVSGTGVVRATSESSSYADVEFR